jgi:hypothetical protein
MAQFIGPTSNMSQATVYRDTVGWMMRRFIDVRLHDARFVITGPSQSGKSTLLEIAVRLFLQRLQLSGSSGGYLFVIVNWELHGEFIDDLSQLYLIVVTATINGLRCSRMQMIPILDELFKWFASLLNSRFVPPIPQRLRDFKDFPAGAVAALTHQIHDTWHCDDGLTSFLRTITGIPAMLASAFGLEEVVYVFDHFDSIAGNVGQTQFPESPPASFAESLCQAIGDSPFFVASRFDSEFAQSFAATNTISLSTNGIIRNRKAEEVRLSTPNLALRIDACEGCPGFCVLFDRLSEIARRPKSAVDRWAKYQTVADITWKTMIVHKFLQLWLLLADAKHDVDGDHNLAMQIGDNWNFEVVVTPG